MLKFSQKIRLGILIKKNMYFNTLTPSICYVIASSVFLVTTRCEFGSHSTFSVLVSRVSSFCASSRIF